MGSEEHAIERCEICDKSHPHNQARGACDKCRSMIEQSERDIKEGRTMTIDEVIPNPHPDTTELATLYELSDGGTAEWWPEGLEWCEITNNERGYKFILDTGCCTKGAWHRALLQDHHALDIIRGSAERWLRGRGWECVGLAYNTGHNYWCKEDWNLGGVDSLADAIRVEMGREG